MKTTLRTPAVILILITTATATLAQSAPSAASAVNPATGLPVAQPASQATGWAQPAPQAAPIVIDPKTGLPMIPSAPQWIAPDWKDPTKVLPEVNFDGWGVMDVVQYLRGQFSNDFDIVVPSYYYHKARLPNVTRPNDIDTRYYEVNLRLRNVTASEVFQAMNWQFENENDPLRWELTMNGNRPTALLRFVPALLPSPPPRPQPVRNVFFVGNLIGDERAGGMTMEQLVQTVSEVWAKAYGQAGVVQFYKPAQLLIVTGSPDQTEFIQQTLSALRQKVELARRGHPESAATTSKTSEPKPGASAGSK